MTVVQSMIKPERDAIKAHLDALFAPAQREYPGGLIELRYGPPDHLDKWVYFNLQDGGLNEAADFATRVNNEGSNVYVGVNPRKPNTNFRRASNTHDVEISFFHFADIDKAESVVGLVERYGSLPPTMTVTTGSVPNKRPHLYWRLEEPIMNLAEWTERQRGIAQCLGGDMVIDPPRIMRLGGTVNFPTPKKLEKGYKVELTAVRTEFATERADVTPEQIAQSYPKRATESVTPEKPVTGQTTLSEMAGERTGFRAADYIARIMADDAWHNNYRDLVAHWVSIGWSNDEILLTAPALTVGGYDVAATEKKVREYITSARTKYNAPDPERIVEPLDSPENDFAPTPWSCLSPAKIPPREWLYGDFLVRRFVSMLVAPPGVGKSTFTIHVAVAAALKCQFGPYIAHEQTNVWIFNNEDPRDELDRRISAVLIAGGIDPSELAGRLFVDTGEERQLLIARRDAKTGDVIQMPVVEAVIQHIRKNNIGLWVVDPFLETHAVSENSNEEINKVARMYRRIAQQTGCAIWLVHHTRKPASGALGGSPGDADAARGAGSLGGVVRFASTLFPMSEADAKAANIPDDERHLFVRLDDAKANLKLKTNNAVWWKKETIDLGNACGFRSSDEVGVLAHVEMADRTEGKRQRETNNWAILSHALLAQFEGDSMTLNRAAYLLGSVAEPLGLTSQRSIERFLEERLRTPHRVGAWEMKLVLESRKGGSRWIDRRVLKEFN